GVDLDIDAGGILRKNGNNYGGGSGSLTGTLLGSIFSGCPHTGFADVPLPNGTAIDAYVAQMSVFRKETLVDLTPSGIGNLDLGNGPIGLGIDAYGSGTFDKTWHVYMGSMLFCDNLVTNVIFLGHPVNRTWHGQDGTGKLRPYETDLAYVCTNTPDPEP